MVLTKISIDNSVRYVPKSEQTNEIKNKKQIQGEGKPNKKFSKNKKKFVEDFTASGFGVLTK